VEQYTRSGSLHVGQQLYLSPPADQAQPSLFSLSESGLQSKPVTTPGLEGKQALNTDKLKNGPRAFKVRRISEQSLAQLKGLAGCARNSYSGNRQGKSSP
jgi:lipoprotein NlpD